MSMIPVCKACGRGAEACEWCEHEGESDWVAICDCGLLDFGGHLTDCESRDDFLYVVPAGHDSALLPRPRFVVGSVTGGAIDPTRLTLGKQTSLRRPLPTSFYVYDRAYCWKVVAAFESPLTTIGASSSTSNEKRRRAAEVACAEFNARHAPEEVEP